jgi:hypothetical protein
MNSDESSGVSRWRQSNHDASTIRPHSRAVSRRGSARSQQRSRSRSPRSCSQRSGAQPDQPGMGCSRRPGPLRRHARAGGPPACLRPPLSHQTVQLVLWPALGEEERGEDNDTEPATRDVSVDLATQAVADAQLELVVPNLKVVLPKGVGERTDDLGRVWKRSALVEILEAQQAGPYPTPKRPLSAHRLGTRSGCGDEPSAVSHSLPMRICPRSAGLRH